MHVPDHFLFGLPCTLYRTACQWYGFTALFPKFAVTGSRDQQPPTLLVVVSTGSCVRDHASFGIMSFVVIFVCSFGRAPQALQCSRGPAVGKQAARVLTRRRVHAVHMTKSLPELRWSHAVCLEDSCQLAAVVM